jgi:propionyl-CoA synthetase
VSFLVLKVSAKAGSNLVVSQVVASIREINGSIAAFKSAVVVGHLPKTRSGKILHGTVAHIADDAPWTLPATVDDPVNASCCRR